MSRLPGIRDLPTVKTEEKINSYIRVDGKEEWVVENHAENGLDPDTLENLLQQI